jgi:hypothetical protein
LWFVHYIYFITVYSFTSRNVAEDDQSNLEDEYEDPISQGDLTGLTAVSDSTDLEWNEPVEENPGLGDNRNSDNSRHCSPESQPSPAPAPLPCSFYQFNGCNPDVLVPVSRRDDPGDHDQEFTLDGPATCIGRKQRARNLQDMLEVCTCGEHVTQEEILSGQNIIRCTSKGCETQWVSCDLDNRD